MPRGLMHWAVAADGAPDGLGRVASDLSRTLSRKADVGGLGVP